MNDTDRRETIGQNGQQHIKLTPGLILSKDSKREIMAKEQNIRKERKKESR